MTPVARYGFALALVAACVVHHHVQLLLGTADGVPSPGFECRDANGVALLRDAYSGQKSLQLCVVVDTIDLGGVLPGGFASDIIQNCRDHTCTVTSEAKLPIAVAFDPAMPSDLLALMGEIDTALDGGPEVLRNASHAPLMVRVELARPAAVPRDTDDADPCGFTGAADRELLGCAYSTPVVLDDVPDQLQIGIQSQDVLTDPAACLAAITGCASFPAP